MIPKGTRVFINGAHNPKSGYEVLALTDDGRYILGETVLGYRIEKAFIHNDQRELMVMAETHIDRFNRLSKRRRNERIQT